MPGRRNQEYETAGTQNEKAMPGESKMACRGFQEPRLSGGDIRLIQTAYCPEGQVLGPQTIRDK